MKMCLLELYLRLCEAIPLYRQTALILRYILYVTFFAVVFPTLLECRPLEL